MRRLRAYPRARVAGLAIALTVATAAGVTVSGFGGSSGPRSALTQAADLQELGAYTIVYTGSDGVYVVSLNGNRVSRQLSVPAGPPIQTDTGVAFVSSDSLYLLGATFTDARRTAVGAYRLFPMMWPGTVGVATDGARNVERVEYVDLQGNNNRVSGPWWQLPPGYTPVSQFLATGPGGVLQVWEPGQTGRARLGPVIGAHALWVSGAIGPLVAWLAADGCTASGECPLHISGADPTSLSRDRTIVAPPGHGGFLPGGALSPDGQFLAGFVRAPGGRHSLAELDIVDTADLKSTLIGASSVSIGGSTPSAQWTPDGEAVFFSGSKGNMHVYQLGAAHAMTLATHASLSFTVTQSLQGLPAGP